MVTYFSGYKKQWTADDGVFTWAPSFVDDSGNINGGCLVRQDMAKPRFSSEDVVKPRFTDETILKC